MQPIQSPYYLQLPNGHWVSSPVNTTTTVKAQRAAFGTRWSPPETHNREATKARLEAIHGQPLTIIEN